MKALDRQVSFAASVPAFDGDLTRRIIGWIAPIDDLLERSRGSSAQIEAFATQCNAVAAHVESLGSDVATTATRATSAWTGEAADAFAEHADAGVGATNAAARQWRRLASHVLALGSIVAQERELIINEGEALIADIISRATSVSPLFSADPDEWTTSSQAFLTIGTTQPKKP